MISSATNLPDGLDIDPDLGVISGTVADDAIQSTPYVVTVTAADGNGLAASQTFDWFVKDSTMTVQGDAIGQEEGAGDQTFTVASFTDPDLNRQATDYTATIAWGDGQTSQGEVDGSNGAYTVSGDHVYLHPGSFLVQVTVTDPAGGTATGTATATISVAPLTATSGFVDGALKGSASLFTLTTFRDANPYDAAASYTAMIGWGDGSQSLGEVEGADGVFTVAGGHAYGLDGTYTVTATITDADGTTATATGVVQVGDIYAGQTATLNVASFTDLAWQGPTGFTTTIDWGDTGPGGAGPSSSGFANPTGDSNPYSVIGWHTYHAAGTYQVTVSVSDPYGNAITATKEVTVAAPAVTGYAGSVAATVGQPLPTSDPLAVLAGPLAGGGETPSYAVVSWGDDTTSTVGLQENGSLYEVPADHTYQSAGVFAVQTLFYDAAGLLAGAVVSQVAVGGKAYVNGPSVVPGNSDYLYVFWIPPTKHDDINWNGLQFKNSSGEPVKVVKPFVYTASGLNGGWDVTTDFKNDAASLKLTLSNWSVANPNDVISFDVYVVQVKVENVTNAFVPSPALKNNGTQTGWKLEKVTVAGTATVPNQTVHYLDIDSAPGSSPPALKWQAKVTLIGPTVNGEANYGVDRIQVGFHQTDTPLKDRALDKTTILKSSEEGNTYLDSDTKPGVRPWKDVTPSPSTPKLPTIIKGATGPTIIADDDSPTFIPIIHYESPNFYANEVQESDSFDLSVAAATLDTSLHNSESHLFQEASAAWSVNADGTIQINAAKTSATWTPGTNAGVTAPTGDVWDLNIAKPVDLLTTGTLANDVLPTFAYVKR